MKDVQNNKQAISSLFSLQPLISVLKKMIAEEKAGARKLYESLLNEIEAVPELLQPIKDVTVLKKHAELVEALLSTIFPTTATSNGGIYGVSYPFRSETVFASPRFRELFLKEDSNDIILPDKETNVSIVKSSLQLAYNLILRKFYSVSVPIEVSSVHPFEDPETGLVNYLELRLNAHFVEVVCVNESFTLPTNFSPQNTASIDELKELFPLENFRFEGLIVVDVDDVTSDQVIAEIKDILFDIHTSSEVTEYSDIQTHVQTLIGIKDIEVGITPFFKMNNFYLYADSYYRNSLLFKNGHARSEKDKIHVLCQQMFRNSNNPLLYQSLTPKNSSQNDLFGYYFEMGVKSLILCPLRYESGDLVGILEIIAREADTLKFKHVVKIQSALQLFSLALEKTNETLELQIDKTIKEHFTAIQPAVEWKFTEAAFNYLQCKQLYSSAKMQPITFENVYPLYGAIDIRNSSVERNNSIQLDIMEQLNLANEVLVKACKTMEFPLLQEMQFKIEKFIASTSESLLSDDEMVIYDFLQIDVDSIFRHLRAERPELKKAIDNYYNSLDTQRNLIYHHRKEYEESITRINDALDRFIDEEQKAAQQLFPHYFERYITDGIEFNIYVGQSLAPQHQFDTIYLKNLKLWQISVLAKAARLTHALEKKLSLPLQTTQLILAHSVPLTISFRRKERKFDVDGAYNIRYEIVKKRIDKVHLRDSDERLTQPGKIAIVYSQQKELNEYMEYIEFLQHEGWLTENIEQLELEDTQGINGLKAIRVEVNLNAQDEKGKVELSKVTAQHFLKK